MIDGETSPRRELRSGSAGGIVEAAVASGRRQNMDRKHRL